MVSTRHGVWAEAEEKAALSKRRTGSTRHQAKAKVEDKAAVSKRRYYLTRSLAHHMERSCQAEKESNTASYSRILELFFDSQDRLLCVTLPGSSHHALRLMSELYQGRKYHVRFSVDHEYRMSTTIEFGQIISVIVTRESLEKACQEVGEILNDTISRTLEEEDTLLALPNPSFHVYDVPGKDDAHVYDVYETWVTVDFGTPQQVDPGSLLQIQGQCKVDSEADRFFGYAATIGSTRSPLGPSSSVSQASYIKLTRGNLSLFACAKSHWQHKISTRAVLFSIAGVIRFCLLPGVDENNLKL